MKMHINSDFQSLEAFLRSLPSVFEKNGESIYKSRNELKIFEQQGFLLNVKRYRKPILANRIAYTFFRKSKARRAFVNAHILQSKGFETPMPIAFLELSEHGLLKDSYFVSFHCPYKRLFREFADGSPIAGREEIIREFGVLLARLHDASILHLDLSVGNILFEKLPDGCHFSLVDLNRMKFQKIPQKKGCQNFERLRGSDDFFKLLAETYAKERGFDATDCLQMVLKAKNKSILRFHRKSTFKKRRALLKQLFKKA